jgi:hypothetical protein
LAHGFRILGSADSGPMVRQTMVTSMWWRLLTLRWTVAERWKGPGTRCPKGPPHWSARSNLLKFPEPHKKCHQLEI